MPEVIAPTNFSVVRSEDRESALLTWDTLPLRRVYTQFQLQYLPWPDGQVRSGELAPNVMPVAPNPQHSPLPDIYMHMYDRTTTYTGSTPGRYRMTIMSVVNSYNAGNLGFYYTNQFQYSVSRDGVTLVPSASVPNAQGYPTFPLVDGLQAQLQGPIGRRYAMLLTPGTWWDIQVAGVEWYDIQAADHYSVYRSERTNGLGYSLAKTVQANTTLLRQSTVIDGLDPDQTYNFKMTATDTDEVTGPYSVEQSDF